MKQNRKLMAFLSIALFLYLQNTAISKEVMNKKPKGVNIWKSQKIEFNVQNLKSDTRFQLVNTLQGPLTYSIYLNGKMIDSGEPEFSSFGILPVETENLKPTNNELSIKVAPLAGKPSFDENSSYDIALLVVGSEGVVSTKVDENLKVLARLSDSKLLAPAEQVQATSVYSKQDYDRFFNKNFPKDFSKKFRWMDDNYSSKNIVGPFLLVVSPINRDVNPTLRIYTFDIPEIEMSKREYFQVKLSKVLSKKNKNVHNPQGSSEKSPFDFIEFGKVDNSGLINKADASELKNFREGRRRVSILGVEAGDFNFNEGFSGYEGRILVTLPLKNGETYHRDFPFVLTNIRP